MNTNTARQVRKQPAKRLFSGMAGSPLAALTVVPPQAAPSNAKPTILVHFCFDQESGESKPNRCKCHYHIFKDKAYELIDAKCADFLLAKNPKTERLTKRHNAIVVRRTTVGGETLYALAAPLKQDSREVKHNAIRSEIRREARRLLQLLLKGGVISQQQYAMSDADLESTLEAPESFLKQISGQERLADKWEAVAIHWWNNILGFYRLSAKTDIFLTDAKSGAGRVVTGGYGMRHVDEVSAAGLFDMGGAEANALGYFARPVRPGGFGPRVDENDDERSARIESEHGREISEDSD